MISRTDSNDLPRFPSDVPTAPIATISLGKLLDSDDNEAEVALEACRTYGFFYLNLMSTSAGEELLDEAESLHQLSKEVFSQPIEYKEPFINVPGNIFGYK